MCEIFKFCVCQRGICKVWVGMCGIFKVWVCLRGICKVLVGMCGIFKVWICVSVEFLKCVLCVWIW